MKIGVVVTCLVTLCALVVGSNQSKADFCPLGVDAGIYACSVRLPSQNGAPALLVFESGVLVDRNTNASQINSSVCRQSNSMTEALDIHQIPPIQHMGFTPQFHWLDTHVPNAGADYELYMTRTKAQMTIKNCIIRQIPLGKNASRLVGSTYQTDSDNGQGNLGKTAFSGEGDLCSLTAAVDGKQKVHFYINADFKVTPTANSGSSTRDAIDLVDGSGQVLKTVAQINHDSKDARIFSVFTETDQITPSGGDTYHLVFKGAPDVTILRNSCAITVLTQ